MTVLEARGLEKVYKTRLGTNEVKALDNVSFSVEEGEYISIMGESGSGKTTLLNVISSLDKVTNGDVILDGKELSKIKDSYMSEFRRENIGFVFQDCNLLNNFSVRDNILLPLVLSSLDYKVMDKKLSQLSEKLGITSLLDKQAYEISGGQKQRVAVARALITEPKIIFADEPTGALDSKSAENLLDLFDDVNNQGQTILMVTHSAKAASRANRVIFIKDGKLFHQIYRGNSTNAEMNQRISDVLSMITTGGEVNE